MAMVAGAQIAATIYLCRFCHIQANMCAIKWNFCIRSNRFSAMSAQLFENRMREREISEFQVLYKAWMWHRDLHIRRKGGHFKWFKCQKTHHFKMYIRYMYTCLVVSMCASFDSIHLDSFSLKSMFILVAVASALRFE